MKIRKRILPLLLTAILIVPAFPAMAMAEEVSPSDAELQKSMTTKTGAVDDQYRMQEILDEIAAEQEELLAAQDESSGKPESGRKDGSELDIVTDSCSYTLTQITTAMRHIRLQSETEVPQAQLFIPAMRMNSGMQALTPHPELMIISRAYQCRKALRR